VNSDFYPILSLEAPRSRFRSTIAATLTGLPTADLPLLELLGKVSLPTGGAALSRGYSRAMNREIAKAIVLARGDKDAEGITAVLRFKMAFVREQIGRCRSREDVKTQLSALSQMAAETIPYLRAEEMTGLWIKPDWIRCSAQVAPVPAMLALLQAAAARNHPTTLARAEGILAGQRAELPDDAADYVLRSAMLAAVATRDFVAVQRLDAAYGAKMRGTPVTDNHRRWMMQIAKEGLSKDGVGAAPGR